MPAKPAKILVVDDEPLLERLIIQQFKQEIKINQYQFLFAPNGIEALKVIQNESIDLLITDINMPEMNGLTLLKKIKEIEIEIKTIVISAYGDPKNIEETINLQGLDFLAKPLDFDELKITIHKTLISES